jgi:hypothetical protein
MWDIAACPGVTLVKAFARPLASFCSMEIHMEKNLCTPLLIGFDGRIIGARALSRPELLSVLYLVPSFRDTVMY